MTEPQIDKPESEQDRSDVVVAEVVQQGRTLLVWGIAAVLICVFLAVDYLTPGYMRRTRGDEWMSAVLIGLCIGEVNLIAVWASLAPGNIVLRIFWSLLLTMAMWYGLILGSVTLSTGYRSGPYMTRADAILLILILLSGVAILQVPLWIAKKVFRWRLTRRPGDTESALQEDRQFHLKHLLIAMVLLSLALSPLRHVLPPGETGPLPVRGEMLAMLCAAILSNLVIALPCVWWAFASRMKLILLAIGWPVYCAVLTAVEFGCLCAVLGQPGTDWYKIAFVFYVLNLSQCAAVLGTLWILRAIGFRMVRMPRRGKREGVSPFREVAETEQA